MADLLLVIDGRYLEGDRNMEHSSHEQKSERVLFARNLPETTESLILKINDTGFYDDDMWHMLLVLPRSNSLVLLSTHYNNLLRLLSTHYNNLLQKNMIKTNLD